MKNVDPVSNGTGNQNKLQQKDHSFDEIKPKSIIHIITVTIASSEVNCEGKLVERE